MLLPITIPCGKLLKYIHVAQLNVGMAIGLIHQPQEQSILIKVVVHNILTHVHHQFIVDQQLKSSGGQALFAQWNKEAKIVANAPVEVKALPQLIVV